MIRKALLNLFVLISMSAMAQVELVSIPSSMVFAGIELKIEGDAKKLMESYVQSLTKSSKYLQIKVERANIYFPLIEKILREEGVPDDFKYLVLQESSLIPDAVSTSNAVGYWQFKKEAASDMDLRIDGDVDERMHIISSTRGAARYLKKNNIYLSNWINALLSYNLGLGGVKLLVDPSDMNASSMKIKGTTHVYILKCLSHKIAFDNALKQTAPMYTLLEYKNCQNKQLKDVALELDVIEEDLIRYNLWLKSRKIPNDKRHSVIVPASEGNYERLLALLGGEKEAIVAVNNIEVKPGNYITKGTTSNNLKAIIAGNAETIKTLSKKGKIAINRFLRYNDLKKDEPLIPGQIYYLEPKKNKAEEEFHTVEANDTYWSISQKYGIKKSSLLKFNRIAKSESLQMGRVMWLSKTRPNSESVEIKVTGNSNINKEVKVITYQDKAVLSKASKENDKVEEEELFPDEFYEENTSSSPATSRDKEGSIEPNSIYPTPSSPNEFHIVAKGETYYSISKLYSLSVQQLKSWNGIMEHEPLAIGKKLVIKAPEVIIPIKENNKKQVFITYTVKSGDTFYKIAREHNVTVSQLQEWNSKKDGNISIGEAIKIYQE